MTNWTRFAAVCGGAVVALALAGCSSATSETPEIEGKTPADFREEMDKKISHPLGEPPPSSKTKRSSSRR